jgi:hypothetical protein
MGLFGGDSTSSQRITDRSLQASGNALVNQVGDRSGNVTNTNKVAAGGSLVINTGLNADDLERALKAQASVNPGFDQDGSFREAVLLSLNQRAAAQTERAVDDLATGAPSNVLKFSVAGVAVLVVLALVFFFGGRRA